MLPAQAASSACAFGMENRRRLNFVRPPLPVETGSPVSVEFVKQSVPSRVDRGRILERRFELLRDLGEPFGIVREKFLDEPVVFCFVARNACQNQVGDSIGSAARARVNVIDVQRYVFRVAVGALAPHFANRYSRTSHPSSVPCWYSTPDISGFSIICMSNRTSSLHDGRDRRPTRASA